MTFSFFRAFYAAVLFLIFTALPLSAQQADLSFGTAGFVNTGFAGGNPFGTNDDTAVKAFYLPDGKILVVANHYHHPVKSFPFYTMRLFRYTNAGVPDAPNPTIPNNGTIGSRYNFVATDAAMQPDGKIVVVGYMFQNASNLNAADWAIARFNQDGTPDTVSGFPWYVTRGFGNNEDYATNVELQTDGKIVVSGYSLGSPGVMVTAVARYNPDATPDLSFGPYGEGFFDIYDNGNLFKKLLIQPDGKFLLAGSAFDWLELSQPSDVYLARYNSNGTPDAGFGSGGYVTLNYNTHEILNDISLQPDGKILVLFDSNFIMPNTFNVAEYTSRLTRFNANGAKDLSFTPNGEVFINTSPPSDFGGYETWRSLIVRDNGNIYVSGISGQKFRGESFVRHLFAVLEYNASGQFVNKTFSRHTQREQIVSPVNRSHVQGSLEQPDGKILIYGWHSEASNFGAPRNAALARYTSVSAVKDANPFFDYDFDKITEYGVYRPSASGLGTWYFLSGSQFFGDEYGAPGDIIAPGDFDGDGIQDLAVFRSSTGEWITRRLRRYDCAPMSCATVIQFGAKGDIPAPGDYDGDGRTDRAVFRPSVGDWYILLSSGGVRGLHFGQNGDKPAVGDYDGDGKSDVAVIRRENGQMFWYILQSSNNQFVGLQFGITEDKTVAADYNGDGKTEVAVWRPSNGTWYVLANYTNFSAVQFGANGDIPEAADYDGDRKADFAVFRPSAGTHYVLQTTTGNSIGVQFGANGDIPIASAYVR